MRALSLILLVAACGAKPVPVASSGGGAAPAAGPGWFCRVDEPDSDDAGKPTAFCHRDGCPDPVQGYHALSSCGHQDVAYCSTASGDDGQVIETTCAASAQACADDAEESDDATMGTITQSPCLATP